MLFIDGTETQKASAKSRGFLYGDGIFTTIKVVDGKFRLLGLHIERLQRDANRLKLNLPPLKPLIEELQQKITQRSGVLRLSFTREEGARGYQFDPAAKSEAVAWFNPRTYAAPEQVQPIHLRWCDTQLATNHPLAGVKHLNRLEQVLARSEWSNEVYQDGLMCDSQGRVLETTCANIFLIKNKQIMTPSIKSNGVLGVMRLHLLESFKQLNLEVREQDIDKQTVLDADELFISNAIQGMVPVESIQGLRYDTGYTNSLIQAVATLGAF